MFSLKVAIWFYFMVKRTKSSLAEKMAQMISNNKKKKVTSTWETTVALFPP